MDWLRKQFRSVKKRARPVLVGAATGGPVGAVAGLLGGAEQAEGVETATQLLQPVIDAVVAGEITAGQALLAGGLAIVGIAVGGFVGYLMGEDKDAAA
jgi:hypothetical protein